MKGTANISKTEDLTCVDMGRISETKGVVALFDNSNIWIEGKKYAGRKKGFKGEDPTWRINFDALYKQVINNREHALVRLYGSEPEKNDAVWTRCRQGGFSLDLCDRSTVTGKEKRVDNKFQNIMVFECGVFYACNLGPNECAEHRTYCIVGGDLDYIDAVEYALKNGHPVEVWSWRGSINHGYIMLKQKYKNMTIHALDDIFGEIGFEQNFSMDERLRLQSVRRDMTVVFTPCDALPFEDLVPLVEKFYTKIMAPAYMVPTEDRKAIFVFLHNRIEPEQMDGYFDCARDILGACHEKCVKSFPEFNTELQEMHDSKKKRRGEEDTDIRDEPWYMVGFKDNNRTKRCEEKKLRHDQRKANMAGIKPCKFREFCLNAERCTFEHSADELRTFAMNGGKSPFKLAKTQLCTKPSCKKQNAVRDLCKYFHEGFEERLCKSCLGIPCIAKTQCSMGNRYERPVLVENDQKYMDLKRKGWIMP